ncbi:hypothetical protein I4U23_005562 [Adineta vaga]|nr:hypothetical protein I4U23_005562 [Adineta vaga]
MAINIIDEDENYTFEILQAHRLPECAALLADSFTKTNPIHLYLHTTYDQFYPMTLFRSDCILKDRLSLVAIHKQTNELHGCIQASDAKTLKEHHPILPTETTIDLENMKAFNDIIEELEEKYFSEYMKMNGQELKENCIVQLLLGGTRVGCEGHGLGTKLRRLALEHAHQRGYKQAIVETSNPVTYHIYMKKLGGKEFASIYAPTWIWKKNGNSSLPFENFERNMSLLVIDL